MINFNSFSHTVAHFFIDRFLPSLIEAQQKIRRIASLAFGFLATGYHAMTRSCAGVRATRQAESSRPLNEWMAVNEKRIQANIPLIEDLKANEAFQYASDEELNTILSYATKTDEVTQCQSWIQDGKWTELVKWIESDRDQNRYILLAAYALKKIEIFELVNALMFADLASVLTPEQTWSIYPVDLGSIAHSDKWKERVPDPKLFEGIPANQRFAIKIDFEQRHPLSYQQRDALGLHPFSSTNYGYIDENEMHVPSLAIIQANCRTRRPGRPISIYPVMHLSKGEDMMARLLKGQHDFAFFPPYSSEKIHGQGIEGFYPYAHDLFHLFFRLKISEKHFQQLIQTGQVLHRCLLEILPYETPMQYDQYGFAQFNKASSQQDQIKWLLESTIGRIIDGNSTFGDRERPSDLSDPKAYLQWIFRQSWKMEKPRHGFEGETFFNPEELINQTVDLVLKFKS